MATVPETTRARIEFYEAHLDAWAEHADAIGLAGGQVAELAALTAAARERWLRADEARNAARAATLDLRSAGEAMHRAGAAMIATVRAHAETAGDPAVYALAQIPPPAARSPVPPPGRPYRPRPALLATGEVLLSWKCDNPRGAGGTVYEVHRTVIPATPTTPTPTGSTTPTPASRTPTSRTHAADAHAATETFLGVTGTRRFLDATLPAGSATALYRITAVRSTTRGEPALFVINLGVRAADAPHAADLHTLRRAA